VSERPASTRGALAANCAACDGDPPLQGRASYHISELSL